MPANYPGQRAKFGAFTLDVTSGELRKHGTKLRLGEQPFQILSLLLERRGELVSREELHNRLWPSDTFVDFDHGLNSAIRRLRDALGDQQEEPCWVETVPRRGYRFIGEVQWVTNGAGVTAKQPVPQKVQEAAEVEHNEDRKTDNSMRKRAVIAVAFAAALAVGAWFAWRVAGERRSASLAAQVKTLAVLPLENLSGDAKQEYFCGWDDG